MTRPVSRRLPVILDPLPDEPWSNYLDRLAADLSVDTRTLRVHLGMPPSRYGELSYREYGIAMTLTTTSQVAAATGLDRQTIANMQLQRFNHTLLRMDDDLVASVDPLAQPGRSNAGGLRLQQAGAAHFHPSTHACPACLALCPHRWQLSWRIRWHVVCPEHGLLVDEVGLPPTTPADVDGVLAAQNRIMRLARGASDSSGRSTWSIVNDTAAAIEIQLFPRTPPARRGENVPTPRQLSELLPEALAWAVRSARTSPEVGRSLRPNSAWASNAAALVVRRRLDDDSAVRAAIENATRGPEKRRMRPSFQYVPSAPSRTTTERAQLNFAAKVPQLMPMCLFSGRLSDLLYPMSLSSGRNVASIAVVIAGVEVSPLRAAELLKLPPNSAQRLISAFATARERGSDEDLWNAIREAGRSLQDASTDYGYRRRAVQDPATLRTLQHTLDIPHPFQSLRRWLLEWWALDYIRSTHRGEVTASQKDAERVEASSGPELRSILATTVEAADVS
ncbi:TniQ family protein [Jatrophihabitans fulvus]